MKPPSIAIIAAASAALAMALCWWLAADHEPAPGRVRTDAQQAQVAAAADSLAGSTGAPVREPAAADGEIRAGEGDPPSPFDQHGTFVVVDHDGVEHAGESGKVEVEIDGASTSFEVREGVWRERDFTPRSRMRVVEATLGGKPVVCDIDLTLDPANPPLHLRGRWLAPVRLRVIGSDTGADLENVRVVELEFREHLYDREHPGRHSGNDPSAVLAAPVLLWPKPGDVRHYFVGARGYAWASVDVDPGSSTERWVRLERGGEVEVAIEGQNPYGATLRLSRDEGGRPLTEVELDEGGVTRLEDVPCGEWHVEVAKGLWFQQPLVFGRARVEVTAGRVATAAIRLRSDVVEPPWVSLAGTLVYPSGWRNPPRIDIEPTGATKEWGSTTWLDAKRDVSGGDECRWTAGRRPAGTYQVRVTGSGFLTRFELPPAGDENVRIVVPEPCDIRVRVLDAETGKVFAIRHEHGWPPVWEMVCPEWEGNNSFERLLLQPDGSYAGQTPPGTIALYVHADGHQASSTRHEVVRGTNEFVVSVARECGVEITLRDGFAIVPWPDDLAASLHDASGKRMNLYESYSVARVAAKAPGEFTLTIPGVAGFEPIPPRTVSVAHATWTMVTVPLQRKR